jgi:hypothetical protein
MQQAGIFTKYRDYNNITGKNIVDRLVQDHNKKLKTDWHVARIVGLDNKERSVLFFIRGKPRAKDTTPLMIPPSIDGVPAVTTPMPKLKFSTGTASKLQDYWDALIRVDETNRKRRLSAAMSPPPTQIPRIGEGPQTAIRRVVAHASESPQVHASEESSQLHAFVSPQVHAFELLPLVEEMSFQCASPQLEKLALKLFETHLGDFTVNRDACSFGGLIETVKASARKKNNMLDMVDSDTEIEDQSHSPATADNEVSDFETTGLVDKDHGSNPSPVTTEEEESDSSDEQVAFPTSLGNTVAVSVREQQDLGTKLGNMAVPAANHLALVLGNTQTTAYHDLTATLGNRELAVWIPPAEMIEAEDLNFDVRMGGKRPSRSYDSTFDLSSQQRPCQLMRWVVTLVAHQWGYNQSHVSRKDKRRIAAAAIRLVAYDWGFKKPIAGTTVVEWHQLFSRSLATGEPRLIDALKPRPCGNSKGSYTDRIEAAHKGYLASLFRQAQSKDGNKATWMEYATTMNILSAVPDDPRPQLQLTHGQLRRWFVQLKGKCTRSVTRPILTERHKELRVEWCTRMKAANDAHCLRFNGASHKREFKAGPPYRCFEDEKFFYTSSGRRKVKQLPHQEGEEPGVANYNPERVASRRFATKVMFAGVVACPHPEYDFDGKIYLKRVSETVVAKKAVYYTNIVDEYEANGLMHKSWRTLHLPAVIPNMTVGELLDSFLAIDEFGVDEDTRERLVLRYCTYPPSTAGKKKWVTMTDDQLLLGHCIRRKAGDALVPITLEDIQLAAVRWSGDTFERDTTCDSEWMKTHMIEMGEAIRTAYWWLPFQQEIELIMDNAGGHGTKDAIEWYERELKDRYNVLIIHQVPRSPETNLLDLGIWCGLQRMVEKVHRNKTKASTDALARTVLNAWSRYDSFEPFYNVYRRWDKVLSLIIAANGDNTLVDKARNELIVPIVMAPPPSRNQAEVLDQEDEQEGELDEEDWFGMEDREAELVYAEESGLI